MNTVKLVPYSEREEGEQEQDNPRHKEHNYSFHSMSETSKDSSTSNSYSSSDIENSTEFENSSESENDSDSMDMSEGEDTPCIKPDKTTAVNKPVKFEGKKAGKGKVNRDINTETNFPLFAGGKLMGDDVQSTFSKPKKLNTNLIGGADITSIQTFQNEQEKLQAKVNRRYKHFHGGKTHTLLGRGKVKTASSPGKASSKSKKGKTSRKTPPKKKSKSTKKNNSKKKQSVKKGKTKPKSKAKSKTKSKTKAKAKSKKTTNKTKNKKK